MEKLNHADAPQTFTGENNQVASTFPSGPELLASMSTKLQPLNERVSKTNTQDEVYINELGQLVRASVHATRTTGEPTKPLDLSGALDSKTVSLLPHTPSKALSGHESHRGSTTLVNAIAPSTSEAIQHSNIVKGVEISLIDLNGTDDRTKEIHRAGEHLKGPNRFVFEYLIKRDGEFERVAGFRSEVSRFKPIITSFA